MSKKMIKLAIGLMAISSLLAGCSSSEDKDSNKIEGVVEKVEGEYFPLDKQITVEIAGKRNDTWATYDEMIYMNELEKKTNMDIEWIDWPNSQYTEKVNLAFASGDIPDAIYGQYILGSGKIIEYGMDGWLLAWNDYINEEYMPNLTALMKQRPAIMESLKAEDGNIYGLPQIGENSQEKVSDTIVVNTEWLKKVGKEMPTNIDEFYELLVAFKEAGDLNGNGKNDEIPFSFQYNSGNTGQLSLMGFTGMVYNDQHRRMAFDEKGEVVYVPQQEEYRTFLEYMHKLFAEDLVDPEVFTMSSSQYSAKTMTSEPTVGVISAWTAEKVNTPIPGNDNTKDGVYQYMKPLDGLNGKDPVWIKRVRPYNGNFAFVVDAESEYIEELVRWADLQFAVDTSIQLLQGPYGVFIEEVGENQYVRLTKEDGTLYSSEEKSYHVPMSQSLAISLEEDFTWGGEILPQTKAAQNAVYGPYLQENYVSTSALLTLDETARSTILEHELKTYVDQQTAKFMTQGVTDEAWEEYVETIDKLGVDEYIKIWSDVDKRAKGL